MVRFCGSGPRIGVRLYIHQKLADWMLPALEAERDAVEAEIGQALSWNPNPDNRDKTVGLHRNANLEDRVTWPEHIEWMTEYVARFRKAFGPRVKKFRQPEVAE